MPDEVTNGLQRAQKPHKTGVRATLRKEVERRREGRKEGMQMEGEKGESHAQREGGERQRETVEEMVGGETSAKV